MRPDWTVMMQESVIALEQIRNIGIIAHIDAGKTTVSERFLYYTGKTHRLGDIDSGTTVLDYLDEERQRGITIVAAAASFNWSFRGRDTLVHLIDTPGHIDFTAEVERSLRVCDGAVVIFSGVEGVEAQSEKVWHQSNNYGVPKIAFVNKLDRLGASFERTVEQIGTHFPELKAIPIQLPVGMESAFSGIIDLIAMQLLTFVGEDGSKVNCGAIPAELAEPARAAREEFLAAIADFSDPIAELFIEEKDIPQELLHDEIRRLTLSRQICPVMAGAAKKNLGIQPLLDAVTAYLPSPADRGAIAGENPKSGERATILPDDHNFAGLIFKVVAGGSADLYYLRTYAGCLAVNDTLYNPRTREKVRIKRLLRLYAKNVEAINKVGPGDIVGLIGPQDLFTGDTLCAVNHPLLLERINFPEPVISIAIEPRSAKDRDRLHHALVMLCREDPTLELEEHETGQLLLSGMGELHLEINTNRIRHEFGIEARYGKPRVAFRETIDGVRTITGIFDRTIGDKPLYAEVDISFSHAPAALSNAVKLNTAGLSQLPRTWLDCAAATLSNALKTGGNRGYSLIYVQAEITAIRGPEDRVTDGAIAGAIMQAVSQAILQGTVMLEPLMRLDITAPDDVIGEITGYLQARRAVIRHLDNLPGNRHLRCEVPLAEMFGFSQALPKLSGGRASFSMEPCGYQPISDLDLERLQNSSSVTF